MIHALIQGELIADPRQRTSGAGNALVTAQMRTQAGDESVLIGLAAFGEAAGKLAALRQGDSLAATGALKANVWTDRQGTERRGWNLTAAAILTVYEATKRRRKAQGAAAGDGRGNGADFPDDAL